MNDLVQPNQPILISNFNCVNNDDDDDEREEKKLVSE